MEVMRISLEIPADVLRAVRLPPGEVEQEFRKELALALYQRGVLPLGKARLLARMTRWEFEELLGQRKILRHYTDMDLEEDIYYGLGH
jgi:predicted HTH domain antitoxin